MATSLKLDSVKGKVLNAANNGIIFPITQDEAETLREWLTLYKLEVVGRRKWIAAKAKEISLDISLEFPAPDDVDDSIVENFIAVLSKISNGDESAARAYTPQQAQHFLRRVVALGNESKFLLELQRVTLKHEKAMGEK